MKINVLTFLVALVFSLFLFSCGGKKNEADGFAQASAVPQSSANAQTVITTLTVSGTTCGRCVGVITNALSAVDGVTNVSVVLQRGGTGVVTVMHDPKITPSEIQRIIIEDAGYGVIGGGN